MPRHTDVLIGIALTAAALPLLLGAQLFTTERDRRIECAGNLRQLGQAFALYANENRGAYPRTVFSINAAGAPGPEAATWGSPYDKDDKLGPVLGNGKDDIANPFAKPDSPVAKYVPRPNDITAAFYLLMRTQDIASTNYICPGATRTVKQSFFQFGGGNRHALHFTNWPGKAALAASLSYSYTNLYPSKEAVQAGFRLNTATAADFVVAADLNPGSKELLTIAPNLPLNAYQSVNSLFHLREGQNVLFADGSVQFAQTPFAGSRGDNIYVSGWSRANIQRDPKDREPVPAAIVGPPMDSYDSVLLPTAADLGIQLPEQPKK